MRGNNPAFILHHICLFHNKYVILQIETLVSETGVSICKIT